MNRLTKSGIVSAKDINELLDECNENQMGKTKAYYKLQEYEDLEEQGKLLKLPCKVGDTVYSIFQNRILEITADEFFISLSMMRHSFGDTVFLTLSEAEAKLAESLRNETDEERCGDIALD